MAAKRAISLEHKPLHTALSVEIVFWITAENYDIAVSFEVYQANGAVRHIGIFLVMLLVAHCFQVFDEFLKGEVPGLFGSFDYAQFYVRNALK